MGRREREREREVTYNERKEKGEREKREEERERRREREEQDRGERGRCRLYSTKERAEPLQPRTQKLSVMFEAAIISSIGWYIVIDMFKLTRLNCKREKVEDLIPHYM